MRHIFQKIDVVVCCSLEETMSIAIIEGMMHEKICITSNTTGIADFIEDGINGFVSRVNDVGHLWQKIKWIIENINQLDRIQKNARITYEKNFSMDKFGERLNMLIDKMC